MTDIKEFKNTESLVDINDISVDKNLPKSERIKEYIRQIKNPYCFKCGDLFAKHHYINFLQCSQLRDTIYYGKRIEYKINSKLFDFADKPVKFKEVSNYVVLCNGILTLIIHK